MFTSCNYDNYLKPCYQINTNGILSMEESFTDSFPSFFPFTSLYLVAPFWADVDISQKVGNISYQVYSTGSPLLDTVNTIISDEENINFLGHWMLVAEWDDVPPYSYDTSQVSSLGIMHIKSRIELGNPFTLNLHISKMQYNET